MHDHLPGPPPEQKVPPEIPRDDSLEGRLIEQFFRFARAPWTQVPAPGLTHGETGIMFFIHGAAEHGHPPRIRDLSKRLQVSSPTVTQHVNSLEARGLVQRDRSENDKREVHITLTEKGKQTLHGHREVMVQNFREFIAKLGEQNAESMLKALQTATEFFIEKTREYK